MPPPQKAAKRSDDQWTEAEWAAWESGNWNKVVKSGNKDSSDAPGGSSSSFAPASRTGQQTTTSSGGTTTGNKNTNSNKNNIRTTDTTREFLTSARFADLKICGDSKKALAEVFQYTTMTKVQEATLPVILQGHDVLARAKTGTGKTLGFLLPTIEKIHRYRQSGAQKEANSRKQFLVHAIAISPTRELAQQIADEAEMLTRTFQNPFEILVCYGGTNMKTDEKALKRSVTIDLLVATPGRLYDHLQNTTAMSDRVWWAKELLTGANGSSFTLILDEADQLLEMGFRDSIVNIINELPEKKMRQSLLFSATVPAVVKQVAGLALKEKEYKYVDCVGDDEPTVALVKQKMVQCETVDLVETLFSVLGQIIRGNTKNYKVICFFITARQAQFMAETACAFVQAERNRRKKSRSAPLNPTRDFEVYEIHSRKSQGARNKASDAFRECSTGIMFSSDVTARGLDYPNVTHVVQVGAPSSREQYLHRLGRTARAGTSGQGVLILHPWEAKVFLKNVKDLKLEDCSSSWDKLYSQDADGDVAMGDAGDDADLGDALTEAVTSVPEQTRNQCYSAWLGYYNGMTARIGWSKETLVQMANNYAEEVLLCDEQPGLLAKTVGMMGLKGVAGLKIEKKGAGKGGDGGDKGGNKGNGKQRNGNGGGGKQNGGGGGGKQDGNGKGGSGKGGGKRTKGGKNKK